MIINYPIYQSWIAIEYSDEKDNRKTPSYENSKQYIILVWKSFSKDKTFLDSASQTQMAVNYFSFKANALVPVAIILPLGWIAMHEISS